MDHRAVHIASYKCDAESCIKILSQMCNFKYDKIECTK